MGYTYAHAAAATLIQQKLAEAVQGIDALCPAAAWNAMAGGIRNNGRPGLCSMAISAVDHALWDLKGRLLDVPLATLWGRTRNAVPVYGSGGFTSYDDQRLAKQLSDWVAQGIGRVKMKVGRNPDADPHRVAVARDAIGRDADLFVDANGGYSRKQALALGQRFRERSGVVWYEEPVGSGDVDGLRLMRDRGPAGMDIAAGEYGFHLPDFRRLLESQAVDVLQIDTTRCGGFTGFFKTAALAEAHEVPISAHCAPALHVALGCCLPELLHIEYFHDHQRIESMLLDGVAAPNGGSLEPDLTRPGVGLEFKQNEAERYRIG